MNQSLTVNIQLFNERIHDIPLEDTVDKLALRLRSNISKQQHELRDAVHLVLGKLFALSASI